MNIEQTYIHFFYRTTSGMKVLCGVCVRHRCSENREEVTCERCLKLLMDPKVLRIIESL
jgi:hypothetical protein